MQRLLLPQFGGRRFERKAPLEGNGSHALPNREPRARKSTEVPTEALEEPARSTAAASSRDIVLGSNEGRVTVNVRDPSVTWRRPKSLSITPDSDLASATSRVSFKWSGERANKPGSRPLLGLKASIGAG